MKAYYAIIPASVRYKRELPDGAKLLYGEITACCDARGCSDQENEYFEKLYGKSERTIQRWVKALEKAGHIDVVIIPTDKGSERRIYIREAFDALQSGQIKGGGDKNVGGGDKNVTQRIRLKTIKTLSGLWPLPKRPRRRKERSCANR